MALWNKNDLENSKPSWLTEEQKRQCFRTVRGWEIPLAGAGVGTGNMEDIFGTTAGVTHTYPTLFRGTNYVGPTELLVAMPMDYSPTGASNSDLAGLYINEPRAAYGLTYPQGKTAGSDLPNFKPYFTAPVSSVSGFTGSTVYATTGITSYIPVIAADANITDLPRNFVFGLTTSNGQGLTGLSLIQGFTSGTFGTLYAVMGNTAGGATSQALTGTALATRQTLVFNQPTSLVGMTAPAQYWDYATARSYVVNRYGGWGGITCGAAVLQVGANATTGNYALSLTVFDGHAITGATGTLNFTLTLTSNNVF